MNTSYYRKSIFQTYPFMTQPVPEYVTISLNGSWHPRTILLMSHSHLLSSDALPRISHSAYCSQCDSRGWGVTDKVHNTDKTTKPTNMFRTTILSVICLSLSENLFWCKSFAGSSVSSENSRMVHEKRQTIFLHLTKFTLSSLQFIQSYIPPAIIILWLILAAVILRNKPQTS
jgi:hypothetical protein